MKRKVLFILICAMTFLTACGANSVASQTVADSLEYTDAATETEDGIEVSSSLFKITLPANVKDSYSAYVDANTITIYHKQSSYDGYGGMVFTIQAFNPPSSFEGNGFNKVGELTDADGNLYTITLGYPTEIQWEPETNMPKDYDILACLSEECVKNLEGINGATYKYAEGTKGEDLYGEIIKKYKTAAKENWNAAKYEENNMSPEFANIVNTDGIDGIGIAYYDITKNGVDECFVGPINNDLNGAAYDIYKIVDGTPTHIVSGGPEDRFYAWNAFLINEYSSGDDEYGKYIYIINDTTPDLTMQFALKHDAYEDSANPWFIAYDDDEGWQHISKADYTMRDYNPDQYEKLDFKPLSKIK